MNEKVSQYISELLDDLEAAYIIIDENLKILRVSQKIIQITGYSDFSLLNKNLLNIHSPNSSQTIKDAIANLQELLKTKCSAELVTISNKVIDMNYKIILHQSDNSQIILLIGTIVKPEHAEEIPSLNLEIYNKLFKLSSSLMLVSSLKSGKILDVNTAFVEKTGFSKNEVIDICISDLNIFEHSEKHEEIINEVSQKKSIKNKFLTFRKKDNSLIYGLFSAEIIEHYEDAILIIIFQDTTDFILKNKELSYSDERFRTVLNSIEAYVIVSEFHSNKILFMNQIAEKSFGSIIGKEAQGILDEKLFPINIISYNELLELSRKEIFQNKVLYNNPLTQKWYEIYDRIITWIDGRNVRFEIINDITDTKAAEILLKESKDKIQYVLDNIKEVVFRMSDSGNWVFLNPSWVDVSGYTVEESIDELFLSFIYPDDRNIMMEQISSLKEKRKDYIRVEVRLSTKYGSYKWTEFYARLTYDNDNKINGLAGTLRDITQRKDIEFMIKRQNDYLTSILNSIPINIFMKDESGKLIFINENTSRFLGKDPNQILGKTDFELFPQHVAEKLANMDNYVRNTRMQHQQFEEELIVGKNTKYTLSGKKIISNMYSEKVLLGYAIDITDRKEIEKRVNIQNELYALITRISSDLISAKSENTLKAINKSLNELSNYIKASQSYIYTLNNNEYKAFLYNLKNEKLLYNELEQNRYTEVFENLNDKDAFCLYLEDDAMILFIKMQYGLQNIGFLGFDIYGAHKEIPNEVIILLKMASEIISGSIERLFFEQELIKARDKAESANDAKSEFLANISHEIRTPLNAIIGFAEMLKEKAVDITEFTYYIKGIIDGGRVLLQLINDILDLSKIEAGKLEVHTNPFNLKELLNEQESLFSLKTTQKKIGFSLEIQSDFPDTIYSDEVKIRQILFNLIGNAIKFTHNGEVRVIVDFEPIKSITSEYINLKIKVVDSGIGIPENYQQSIFDAFNQGNKMEKTKYEGTGLGLAITKRLIEIMGGRIELSSMVNKGSTFGVFLPYIRFEKDNCNSINEEIPENSFKGTNTVLLGNAVNYNEEFINLINYFGFNIEYWNENENVIERIDRFYPNVIFVIIESITKYSKITSILKNNPFLKHIPLIGITTSKNNFSKESEIDFDYKINGNLSRQDFGLEISKILNKEINKPFEEIVKFPISVNESQKELLINNILPDLKNLENSLYIEDIIKFANTLIEKGTEYTLNTISICGEKILEYSKNTDIENIEKIFEEISIYIERLKNDK